jgi:hypothetical protein
MAAVERAARAGDVGGHAAVEPNMGFATLPERNRMASSTTVGTMVAMEWYLAASGAVELVLARAQIAESTRSTAARTPLCERSSSSWRRRFHTVRSATIEAALARSHRRLRVRL